VVKGEAKDREKDRAAVKEEDEVQDKARAAVVVKGVEAEVSDLVVIVFAPTAVLLFHIKRASPVLT